jgi:hypothetical protein
MTEAEWTGTALSVPRPASGQQALDMFHQSEQQQIEVAADFWQRQFVADLSPTLPRASRPLARTAPSSLASSSLPTPTVAGLSRAHTINLAAPGGLRPVSSAPSALLLARSSGGMQQPHAWDEEGGGGGGASWSDVALVARPPPDTHLPVQPQLPRPRNPPRRMTSREDAVYQCEVKGCGKLFSRSYNFKAHLDTHDDKREYPFPCPVEACTKKFVRKTDLQRHHQSVHMKQRNHRCDFCGRLFARKDTLRR